MKQSTKKLLYKIVSSLTLVLPISITLVVSAIYSKPIPNVVILFESATPVEKIADIETHFVIIQDDKYLEIDNSRGAMEVQYLNNDFTLNKNVSEFDGIKKLTLKSGSYMRFITDDFDEIVEKDKQNKLVAVSIFNVETGNKLSLAFIVSILSTLIVVAIISGKMQLQKKYPKTAVFIALLSGTIVLSVINAIIGNILAVFIVATVSWGLYCLEHYYFYNVIDNQIEAEGKATFSKLAEQLANELKESK